jgi:polyphosphate kinase 2 (PPK2 family)
MNASKLAPEDIDLLNSKIGLYHLLKNKNLDLKKALEEARYAVALRKRQEELIKLQNWVIRNDKKVVVIFEGT